jgi:hypothetical protein
LAPFGATASLHVIDKVGSEWMFRTDIATLPASDARSPVDRIGAPGGCRYSGSTSSSLVPVRLQVVARLLDPPQKPRVVFQTALEPVLFRREADQDARWLAVARNDAFLRFGFANVFRAQPGPRIEYLNLR